MTRLTLCLTLVLSSILTAQAMAKEVVSAKVCGASHCREVKDERSLMALHEGGSPTDPPKGASAFYRAELTVKGDGDDRFTFDVVLVPRAGLLRGTNDDGTFTWMPVSDAAVAQFRRMTRGLEPIAAGKLDGLGAPKLPQARVDEVVVVGNDEAAAGGGAPVWPWIAGGVAVLILLGLGLYARTRDHLGLHDESNHPRLAGPQGGGAGPGGV
jgi:hypothetical protein